MILKFTKRAQLLNAFRWLVRACGEKSPRPSYWEVWLHFLRDEIFGLGLFFIFVGGAATVNSLLHKFEGNLDQSLIVFFRTGEYILAGTGLLVMAIVILWAALRLLVRLFFVTPVNVGEGKR